MREDWIDSLKGIAIILVVIAHLNFVSSELNQYIYSFHMPLFFFISGYLFNTEKYMNNGKVFFKRKVYSLIIPYLLLSAVTYIFYLIMDCIYQPEIQNIEIFQKGVLFNIYVVICSLSGYLINTSLWFLPCLFITESLFLILRKDSKNEYNVLILIIFFSVIGFQYGNFIPFRMPWGIDIAFTGIVFHFAGNFFKRNYEDILFKKGYSFIFVLFLIHLILSFTNPRVDMYKLVYNNYFLFYASAFSGILVYIYVFKMTKGSKILTFYGKNSLAVLGFHYLIISILKYLLPTLFEQFNLQIGEGMFFIINLFFTLLLIVPLIIITDKYFPYIAGKNRQMKEVKVKK
ncbi:MAG: hypothetical protein QG610_890 [Euryarchaeota archaeon]|nr:hypothetical protein [Euryarchaeota archaeon]